MSGGQQKGIIRAKLKKYVFCFKERIFPPISIFLQKKKKVWGANVRPRKRQPKKVEIQNPRIVLYTGVRT